MKYIMIAVTLFINVSSFSQLTSFDLNTVPDSVKKKASIIKRYENIVFEVSDIEKATEDVQQIYTVLSEEGKSKLFFYQYSSKWISFEDVEIKVYDANGKQTGKYKKRDMTTVATGEGLIDDGFYTYFNVSASSYPITVEYRYRLKYKGTLWYPDYSVNGTAQGVENSTFVARVPKELDLRYKEINIHLPPKITEDGKDKVYQWSVKNLCPIEFEEGAAYNNKYPSIMLAPNRFTIYGYEGTLNSWKDYGKWINDLTTGLDVLPEERRQFFRELVKSAPDDREKARLVYDYLQKNFRYVSIQLGIGGLRPFSADFTDKKKYGDCKALSNYMKAALAASGVKSYVALINAQYNGEPVDPDFPSQAFNHVILCIPQKNDSVWLECTSSTSDFGVLGTFTENRNALLITENGGVLVSTPKSKSKANKFFTNSIVFLQEDGSGKTVSSISTTGEYKEMMSDMMKEKDDDKKDFLVNGLGFKQPDEFKLKEQEAHTENLVINLEMNIEKIPEFKTASKMFLNPRIYKMYSVKMPKAENRKYDYYFRYPFEKYDTTIFKLPEGFIPEALPQAKETKCEFATYTTKYWYNEKEKAVYSSAKLDLLQHRIPAAKYASVKSFFDEVLMDNSQRIVIKKN